MKKIQNILLVYLHLYEVIAKCLYARRCFKFHLGIVFNDFGPYSSTVPKNEQCLI